MKKYVAMFAAGLIYCLASPSYAGSSTHFIDVKSQGLWGVLDQRGNVIVPLQYDSVFVRDDGFISAIKDNDERYFNAHGQQIWIGLHSVGNEDSNGYFTFVGPTKLTGLMDRDGNQILPAMFGYINPFDHALNYVVHRRGRAFVINLQGEKIFSGDFFYISGVAKNGLAIAKPDLHSYGAVDRSGVWVIRPGEFDELWQFDDEGLAAAKLGGKWGLIDAKGHWIIKPISEDDFWIEPFNEVGTTAVKIGGKWGFINRRGFIVVKPVFDEIRRSHNGAYLVQIGGQGVLVDGRGHYLLRTKFSVLTEFDSEGFALAWQSDKSFLINRKGKPMFANRFEDIGIFDGRGWAPAKSGGKWGAIDTSGNWIVKPTFDCVSFCSNEPPPPLEMREIPPEG